MKFNWEQSGMPASLVSRMGLENDLADYKSALANAKQELDAANRRYEQLTADLARRGIPLVDGTLPPPAERQDDLDSGDPSAPEKDPGADGQAEWEEWDRRFRALLG